MQQGFHGAEHREDKSHGGLGVKPQWQTRMSSGRCLSDFDVLRGSAAGFSTQNDLSYIIYDNMFICLYMFLQNK